MTMFRKGDVVTLETGGEREVIEYDPHSRLVRVTDCDLDAALRKAGIR